MTFRKNLCSIVATTALGIMGCDQKQNIEIPETITISGEPISVAYSSSSPYEKGSFVGVFEVDGKYLIAYRQITENDISKVEAAAVVQSEINDGDNEKVIMDGYYKKNKFRLNSLEANDLKIDF